MIRWLFHMRWWWLLGLVVGLLALTPSLQQAVVPDNSVTVWFMEDDPKIKNYERFHERFGNDEIVAIHLSRADGFRQRETLETLQRLVDRLEGIDGVARVSSLLSGRDAFDSEEGLSFNRLLSQPLAHGQELEIELGRVYESPMFVGRLVHEDAKSAMVWVEMDTSEDFDAERDRVVSSIRAVVESASEQFEHALGGFGVVYEGLNSLTRRDFALFLGLCYLALLLVLFWVFRSWRLVLATLGVMTLSSMGAIALLGHAGHQINMVTSVLPTIILVIGIADVVHFPTAFVHEMRLQGDVDRTAVIRATFKRVLLPCVLTTFTTMVGFFALMSSPMAVMQQLGMYAAIGVGLALVASVILMLCAFYSFPATPNLPRHRGLTWFMEWMQWQLHTRTRLLASVALLVAGVSALFALRVEADTFTLGYLPPDHEISRSHRAIISQWGHYSPLDYTVVPSSGYSADSPEVIAGLERFIRAAEALPEVRYGSSSHLFYRRFAEAFGAELQADEMMSSPLIQQLGLLIGSEGLEWDRDSAEYRDNYLAPFQTHDQDLARVNLIVEMGGAKHFESLLAQLQPIAEREMGGAATLVPGGYLPLYVSIIDYVLSSQVRSFFLALGFIFVLMLVWLRSLRLALIAMVPNAFPVLVMFGVMGMLQIKLEIVSATVAAIVLGVAIDDTVHFLHHWREAERRNLSWEQALAWTFERAVRPACITSVLLLVGYPLLMLSQVEPVTNFGLLTAVSVAAALFADLVVLPVLLKCFPARQAAPVEARVRSFELTEEMRPTQEVFARDTTRFQGVG